MSRPDKNVMRLDQTHAWPGLTAEYACDLTRYLDRQAGLTGRMAHYILDSPDCRDDGTKIYPIRIPGGTVGALWLDKDSRIVKTTLDTNYVVKTYPADIREKLKQFTGMSVTFPGSDVKRGD